jgi:hypothetical protein
VLSIRPDVVRGFLLSGLPAAVTHNVARAFTVTAELPANYTFLPKDRGRHTFTVRLLTIGSGQSLTVTDANDPHRNGTRGPIAVR